MRSRRIADSEQVQGVHFAPSQYIRGPTNHFVGTRRGYDLRTSSFSSSTDQGTYGESERMCFLKRSGDCSLAGIVLERRDCPVESLE